MRLAVTGPLFSGKSTLAKALEARGYVWLNYTRYLKELAVKALSAVGIVVTVEEIEADKEKYRQFLIELGHLYGFDEGAAVGELLDRIDDTQQNVIFDNVRYPAQFDQLEDAGFVLLRLTTPEQVRIARAHAQEMTRERYAERMADPSEHAMDNTRYETELYLSVNGLIDDVVGELLTLVEALETDVALVGEIEEMESEEEEEAS